MTIPLHFLTRYAIPLIVAAIYIQDADIREQVSIFSKTERLADEALSAARKEGEGPETFDYIIVGAGSAGAIVANRLSASGQSSVLLLEAGGDPNPIREIPFASGLIGGAANDNWGFTTVKQEHGCLAMDGICPFGMGKAVGGGSSINGGVYNRCKPKDYDHWANFTGDQSWSWQNIKDTYNSFEDYHGHYEESAGDRHGYGGEMYVGTIDYMPGQEVVEEAVREKGFPIGDLNGGEDFTVGFSKYDYNVKDGMRWGTYQAFLHPILDRPNLSIYRYAHATKIETMLMPDQQTYQAVSVTYERHGVTRTARVAKEVILSAGAVGSPQLLMLSGIGPRQHLEELGIPALIDLPVGQYLQDHQGVLLVGEDGGFHVNTSFATDPKTPENALQYITNGTGPMSIHNFDLGWGGTGCPIMKGYMTSSQNDDTAWPEVQMDILQRYHIATERQEFSAYVEVMRMDNTGQITLASTDPHEQPLIDPRIFADPEDVEKVVEGIEQVRDIFLNSQTFQRYGVQPIAGNYQPCQALEGRDYWRCIVTHKGRVFNHPTSTCRMGPNPTVAVLDSKLKVFGTQNIRVMDTSAIPFVPSGNTNLPAMLIGARGAEIILAEI